MTGPCFPCAAVGYLCTAALVVFTGGYVGKALYLYDTPDTEGFQPSTLATSAFWAPDGIFWIMGLGTLVLLYAFAGAVYLLYQGSLKAVQFLCCRMLFFWCPCAQAEAVEEDLRRRRRHDEYEFDALPTDPDYQPPARKPSRKRRPAAALLGRTGDESDSAAEEV